MDKKIIQRLGNYPNEKYKLALMYSPHLSRKSALRLFNQLSIELMDCLKLWREPGTREQRGTLLRSNLR